MHELSIMQGAMDTVLSEARNQQASRVLRVTMRIGDLTGLVPGSLQFAFEVLRANTPASEAVLEVESVPASCYCERCRRRFRQAGPFDRTCPGCGSSPCAIVAGREVEVASIEVE